MSLPELFSSPTRQSIFAIIVIIFKYIRILIRQLIPLIAIAYFGGERSKDYLFYIVIAASIFYMIWSIISYFKFYFFLKNDELHISKGILRKTKLNIPFDRIQTINFSQNLVHRIFSVVQLEIDTAGSAGNEFAFDALSQEKAEMLREILLKGKAKAAATADSQKIVEVDTSIISKPVKEEILRLKPLDLIKIGVSENHLRSGGIIFIAFFGIFELLEDIGFGTDELVERAMVDSIKAGLALTMFFIIMFIVVSFTISLFRSLLGYYDLTLWREGKQYKLVAGLLTRKEKTAPLSKIQIIQWKDDPLKRLFGFFEVSIKQAASAEVAALKSMRIPGCNLGQVNFLTHNWLGTKQIENLEKQGVTKHYLYRRILWRMLFAVPFFVFSVYLQKIWMIALGAIMIPYFIWTSILSFNKAGFAINDQVLGIYRGMFGDEYAVLPLYKIQNTIIKQTPYQHRRDLANLQVFTASGNMTIPYISLDTAKILQDYFLYKVESSKRKWM